MRTTNRAIGFSQENNLSSLIPVCDYAKTYMKEDHRSYRRNFCSCACTGILTLDLCDTGGALYQLSSQVNWEQVVELVRYKQAVKVINCKSCVNNCDDLLSYSSSPRSFHIWFSYIHNFIIILSQVYKEPNQAMTSSRLARSSALERCTGISDRPSRIVLLKVAYYATSSARNFAKLCQNYARIPQLCSQNDVDSVHIGAQ